LNIVDVCEIGSPLPADILLNLLVMVVSNFPIRKTMNRINTAIEKRAITVKKTSSIAPSYS